MFRKLLGVVTAAIAGMLLVGVAWAAGDGVEDISSGNTEGTAASSTQATAGSSTQATTASSSSLGTTGSSTPATTGTSDDSSTSISVANSSTTSVNLVDTSTTSTTVPGSSTSTSIDDDREETRGPAPVNAGPTSHQVGSAGTVTVQITDGHLLLIAATAAPGWETEVDRDDGEEVRVEFESGESDARFEARVHNGELRVRIQAG